MRSSWYCRDPQADAARLIVARAGLVQIAARGVVGLIQEVAELIDAQADEPPDKPS